MHNIKPQFSVTAFSLTAWVRDMGDRSFTVKTIKLYLSGVRSHQLDIGYAELDVFHGPQINRIVMRIRKVRGDASAKGRLLIIRDLLLRILMHFDTFT